MKYLLIANKGLLESDALTLLGASTKRGDRTKIGKFGSGNKYALAYFIRHGCSIRIFSGNDEIVIGLKHKTFRSNEFDVITVNGHETSITTDFGYEWDTWQAIRELYSNAVDEGLLFFDYVNVIDDFHTDDLDTTRIYIEANKDVEDFMFNIDDYIAINAESLYKCDNGSIYKKHGSVACVFYRGIKCYNTSEPSIFDYDLNEVSLNESRLAMYSWTIPEKIWGILFTCTNPIVIRTVLHKIQQGGFIECNIDGLFVTVPLIENADLWLEAIGTNTIAPKYMSGYIDEADRATTFILPNNLYTALVSALGSSIKNRAFTTSIGGHLYREIAVDSMQLASLEEVKSFFDICNFKIPYNIKIVDFIDSSVMGSIDDNLILLSSKTFGKGKQYVANTIIEEYIHIKHQVSDKSRAFQEVAIDELINYMKKQNAIIL